MERSNRSLNELAIRFIRWLTCFLIWQNYQNAEKVISDSNSSEVKRAAAQKVLDLIPSDLEELSDEQLEKVSKAVKAAWEKV